MRSANVLMLALFILFDCNHTSIIDAELEQALPRFAEYINTKNADSLKIITTQKGYNSLVFYSDSLQNEAFIKGLSNHLQNYHQGVFALNDYDSLVYLSLGKPDDIVGATGGYLVLRRTDNQIKVEKFIGGK